ncbi:hypothetical protein IJ00_26770 (plasmid) [Calothrix sp. 336/3]|nr:hypothetical protein IJ00_26770 [Calothrix sp. 336/3]
MPDDIAEQLEALQTPEDSSISLVAKRILLGAIATAERKTTTDEKLDILIGELAAIKKLCP